MSKKIVVFSGSARAGSVNKKVAQVAAKTLSGLGNSAELIDLGNFTAPVYNGDVEAEGFPDAIIALKQIIEGADALVISTPEYNGSLPPLLVNTFAWLSRTGDEVLAGKTAAILAASPGGLGGVRVVPRLRDFLSELGVHVIPGFVTVPRAYDAFNTEDALTDTQVADSITNHMSKLIATLN